MAQDRKLNEERVRSLDDQERVATLKRNLPELEKLWSEEFTVNAPNNKVVIGRRAVDGQTRHIGAGHRRAVQTPLVTEA